MGTVEWRAGGNPEWRRRGTAPLTFSTFFHEMPPLGIVVTVIEKRHGIVRCRRRCKRVDASTRRPNPEGARCCGRCPIAKALPSITASPAASWPPSGLAYDASIDTLYIVDGTNNTVVAFDNVTTIPNGGIIVEKGKDVQRAVRGRRHSGFLRLSTRRSH